MLLYAANILSHKKYKNYIDREVNATISFQYRVTIVETMHQYRRKSCYYVLPGYCTILTYATSALEIRLVQNLVFKF